MTHNIRKRAEPQLTLLYFFFGRLAGRTPSLSKLYMILRIAHTKCNLAIKCLRSGGQVLRDAFKSNNILDLSPPSALDAPFFPTTYILRVSFSLIPKRIETDCRNGVFPTLPRHQNLGRRYQYRSLIHPVIMGSGPCSESCTTQHNNTTQHNTTQRNTRQRNTTQHTAATKAVVAAAVTAAEAPAAACYRCCC